MDRRQLEQVVNEMLSYVGILIDEGVIDLNTKAIFNAASDDGEGVILVVLRTHRVLSAEEVEASFGVATDKVDFTQKRPNLTLVKNDGKEN